MATSTYFNFHKLKFCHSQNETLTIIYNSIENFIGYKMLLNFGDKYAVLQIFSISYHPKTMKNSCVLKLDLYDMRLPSHRTNPTIFGVDRTCQGL